MSKVTDTFVKFLADDSALDMFITGPAGTGKTTQLSDQVTYCIEQEIPYVVCAYTHRACEILRSKLPEGAVVTTLHSWLKKRPGVNTNAVHIKAIDVNTRCGRSARPRVVFIDEYSMVGEKDGQDIAYEQDPDYSGEPSIKVVYLGDPNQLPPVGDTPYVKPYGDYNVKLTKIWRQGADNPLLGPLHQLVGMINGEPMKPLEANANFIRGQDIVEHYLELLVCADQYEQKADAVILAYTNERVEELNRSIQGYSEPVAGDLLFSPSTQQEYMFMGWVEDPDYIDTPFSGELHKDSKYKTLEYLISSSNCKFAEVQDGDGNILTVACTFGHYQHKIKLEKLKSDAAKSNLEIEQKHRGYKAAAWAKNNSKTKLARTRAKAWRDFLSYDECVICLDFNHAMTVHKSQGSTFHTVYVDIEDLYKCAKMNPAMYLKLMYVALSRASHTVITN